MSKTIPMRVAGPGDVEAAAQTLAAAFQHDPVMSWMLPDPTRRAVGLRRFFATMARHVFVPVGASDLALRPDRTVAGVALWTPPEHARTPARTELRMLPSILRALGRRALVGKKLGDLLKENHPGEPHWYLGTIGTAPDARGDGFGSALLRSRLDRIDAEGADAYLESSNPDNIGYYERFGFTVTGELRLPGGPSIWPMLRARR
ncbi:GNAT family N-acetyltransferase [Nocardia halotolerans]|uniref:GNAT family N-acetyltransferase n=1 Tax=Nocardia halotolerans TaxID=1755878 RepID=A0ABV8VC81_9NOCA